MGGLCGRQMTRPNVAPSNAVHGVGDAPPCSPGREKIVKIYRYVVGSGWHGNESKLGAKFGPFDPGSLVLFLRVASSAGVD